MARTSVLALSAFALLVLARPQGSDSLLMSIVAEADGVPVPTSWTTIDPEPTPSTEGNLDYDFNLNSVEDSIEFPASSDLIVCGSCSGDCEDTTDSDGDWNSDDFLINGGSPDSFIDGLSEYSYSQGHPPLPTNSAIVPPWMLSSGALEATISMPADAIITSSGAAYTPPPRTISSSSSSASSRSSSSRSSASATSAPTSVPTGGATTNKVAHAGLVLAGLGLAAAL